VFFPIKWYQSLVRLHTRDPISRINRRDMKIANAAVSPKLGFRRGGSGIPKLGFHMGCSSVPRLGFRRGGNIVPKLGFRKGCSSIPKLGFRKGGNNIPKLGFCKGYNDVPKLGFHSGPGFAIAQTCDSRQVHAVGGATCSGVGRDRSGGGSRRCAGGLLVVWSCPGNATKRQCNGDCDQVCWSVILGGAIFVFLI